VTPVASRAGGRRYVLDANALLGFFEARQGAALKIRKLFDEARRQDRPLLMSAVTWGEVFYIEWRWHGEAGARQAEAVLQELPIVVIGVDRERASRAGGLKQKHGLGYADAFVAELAIERGASLVTATAREVSRSINMDLPSIPREFAS
jgi:predicted nucleic acid-binding protein